MRRASEIGEGFWDGWLVGLGVFVVIPGVVVKTRSYPYILYLIRGGRFA